ncbi:MAG: hypothetical protein RSA29_02560 [Clostridium sp.]|uniref:hypothetical protein n=1 Tax=Clostridium sp. TaxID=1506 RepID=UPI003073F79D
METISIGAICAVIGAVIGISTFKRNQNKDIKQEGRDDAVISTKLEYISRGVDDIRLEIKAQDRKIEDINGRLIRVEESTKSAHKRIDSLEDKEE